MSTATYFILTVIAIDIGYNSVSSADILKKKFCNGGECEKDDTTYVNGVIGSTGPSCGSSTIPCKYLSDGMINAKQWGKVFLTGLQVIDGIDQKQIKVPKSLALFGDQSAFITGSARVAFKIQTEVVFHITNIVFKDIVVLNIKKQADIVMENCSLVATKTWGTTLRGLIQITPEGEGTSLRVSGCKLQYPGHILTLVPNSRASTSTAASAILSRIKFERSGFLNTEGILITTANRVDIKISACSFLNSKEISVNASNIADMTISSSSFTDGTAIKVSSTNLEELTISGCNFLRSKEISVTAPEIADIAVTSSNFANSTGIRILTSSLKKMKVSKCKFKNYPCSAISVLQYLMSRPSTTAIIGNVFNTTTDVCQNGGAVKLMQIEKVLMHSNHFIDNVVTGKRGQGGAVYVKDSLDVNIHSSTFSRCMTLRKNTTKDIDNPKASFDDRGGALFILKAASTKLFNNSFRDCSTDRYGGAISIGQSKEITIKDSSFTRCVAGANAGALYILGATNSHISNCQFDDNRAGARKPGENESYSRNGGAIQINGVNKLNIVSCKFRNNNATESGGAIEIKSKRNAPKGKNNFINCVFIGNKALIYGGAVAIRKLGRTEIRSCRFFGNNAVDGGAVHIFNTDEKKIKSFISGSSFANNSAVIGGGVYLLSRDIFNRSVGFVIQDCNFSNNSASQLGQSIYSNEEIALDNIRIDGYDKENVYHLHAIFGDIVFTNSSFELHRQDDTRPHIKINAVFLSSNHIKMANNSLNLICPFGYNVEAKNSSYRKNVAKKDLRIYTFFKVECESCPYGTYNLFQGKLNVENIQTQPQLQNHTCEKCPTGAICDIEVKSVDNYWGYKRTETKLSFILCPLGYCCSAETTPCKGYQKCRKGRSGRFCSICANGYKQSFFSGECIESGNDCDANAFLLYICFYCVAYTIIIIAVTNAKDIVLGLKDLMTSKKELDKAEEESKENKDENIMIVDSPPVDSTFSMGAFVQIVILYFQVASLLRVKYQGQNQTETTGNKDSTRGIVGDIANFQVAVYQGVCPSNSLTLPQKEMILFTVKMVTFLVLVIIFLLSEVFRLLFCRNRDNELQVESSIELTGEPLDADASQSGRNSDENVEVVPTSCLSFAGRLKYTVLKLMKMYYTPITKACLTMIHCVPVHGVNYLYVYGEQVCYSSWQIVIIVVILPGIILFPICLEMALRLLKQKQISTRTFVLATACPYYAFILYVWRVIRGPHSHLRRSNEEIALVRVILEAEEEVFTETKGAVGWNIVQFYRTFFLTFITICIINPVYRQICLLPLLLLFAVYDRHREPYQNWYLNNLNTFASRCLVLVLGCNVIAAVSYIVNVSITPYISTALRVLSIVEMILYAVVPATFPVWKIWMLFQNRRKKEN